MTTPSNSKTLLRVENLVKNYSVPSNSWIGQIGLKNVLVKALQDVSFEIEKGQTLGIVGESGCGKSTLGRCVMNLISSDSGSIWFDGKNTKSFSKEDKKQFRRKVQMIFQDPYGSLNPRMILQDILEEPLLIHKNLRTSAERKERVKEILSLVGLRPDHLARYPHEFSGGQRQRIGIARSLVVQPELIICDEPLSSLDVSVQAQIINLLIELQSKLNLTYLFISHNLGVVEYLADSVAVVYLGKIVEMGKANEVFLEPKHPYTKALLSAAPVFSPKSGSTLPNRLIIKGEVPDPTNPPPGCQFHTRCPIADENCHRNIPPVRGYGTHKVSCLKTS